MNKWISVNDKVPEHSHLVLVLLENKVIRLAKYKPHCFWQSIKPGGKSDYWEIPEEWFPVTHWMELPKPEDIDNVNASSSN